MSIHYLITENLNDEDVSLFKFRDRASAFSYIKEMDVEEFALTDIVEQSGSVMGYEPEDFETVINLE